MKFILFIGLVPLIAWAGEVHHSEGRAKPKAKAKAKTEMHFDGKVVEGQASGSLYGVVEGSATNTDTGIVELREHFLDKLAEDAGEPIQ